MKTKPPRPRPSLIKFVALGVLGCITFVACDFLPEALEQQGVSGNSLVLIRIGVWLTNFGTWAAIAYVARDEYEGRH